MHGCLGRCEICGAPEAARRRCTGQVICKRCRGHPENQIITGFEVKKRVPELSEADLLPLRAGFIPNPVHRAFSRVPVYFWKDVALLCLQRGLFLE